jgi:flagella synthesis protein FlgN
MSTSIQLLAKQYKQLQLLENIIAEEKDILQQHNPDALLKVSQEKNTLLIAIESLDKEIVQHPDFTTDKSTGKLDKPLAAITKLLETCQQKNLVNGQIIQQSQLAVERMKTTLLESHNKSAITYDNKGKKSAGLSSIGLKA